jgi:iron(III) transport system substrate-binding protein
VTTRSFLPSLLVACFVAGCSPKTEQEVVLYTTVDQEISAPILSAFHRAESNKIQPQAIFSDSSLTPDDSSDVLWTDDILLMIELQKSGLLMPRKWKGTLDFPEDIKDSNGAWHGFAATARVLMVNTNNMPDETARPTSVDDLADPRWHRRCAIAIPNSGTAATHAAIITQSKGIDQAKEWFAKVASNAVLLPTSSAVAASVAAGRVDWGLTDSNYAVVAQDGAGPIAIVFPDQDTIQPGTVRLPQAVAVLANAPHPGAAAKLADYLVLPITEDRLAMSDAAQIPLSRKATFKPRVLTNQSVRWATVDFVAAYETWQAIAPDVLRSFEEAK